MKSQGLNFYHPLAFWLGCLGITLGVLAHVPMFMHASHMNYQMVGMPMDSNMLIGMGLIPLGLVLAMYGMMPRLDQLRSNDNSRLHFHVADQLPLNKEHWTLVMVLMAAVIVDVMKPATLGFVMPGLKAEYGISSKEAGVLALVALTGTTIGSVLWGMMADLFSRGIDLQTKALRPTFKEAPELYESYADMELNKWITMRIEVNGTQAKLFLHKNQQPSLIVNDLKIAHPDIENLIHDFESNTYQGYTFKNSCVKGQYYNVYYEDYRYSTLKFEEIGSTLYNIVEAKNYFIPNSVSSFMFVMFYVTYFLSVLILLFKWINWKQFLLFLLINGVLLAILGVFEAIYRFKGVLILNFTLIIMLISYFILVKSYFNKMYKWWNNQWSIFAYLFLPTIFIFLLGYLDEIFHFWYWDYFKQKYYKRIYNGYEWTMEFTPEYYELKSTVAFICFHSGLLLFVVLLPLLHKVFMRLHALPKSK